jgi:hypothetical protein
MDLVGGVFAKRVAFRFPPLGSALDGSKIGGTQGFPYVLRQTNPVSMCGGVVPLKNSNAAVLPLLTIKTSSVCSWTVEAGVPDPAAPNEIRRVRTNAVTLTVVEGPRPPCPDGMDCKAKH